MLKFIKKKDLFSEYQPIIDANSNQTFAYESLMRSTFKINPLKMIEYAQQQKALYKLDTHCIENAVTEYPYSYIRCHFLFINIFPSTIVHEDFKKFIYNLIRKYPFSKGRIVFEVNEDDSEEHIWTTEAFFKGILGLKSYGFQIAFDDMPVTRTSFEKIRRFKPDFVKLDQTKSKDLSRSLDKQQLISQFLEFTNEKTKLVLEGIETKEDLLIAKQLGVPLLQGYYISKPKRLEVLSNVGTAYERGLR